jgi:Domain of unknown function (DUF5666)
MATGLAMTALVFAAVALAENDPNSGANQPPAQSDQPGNSGEQRAMRLTGTISALDATAGTMTVKGTLFGRTMKVGSSAQIAIEGKTGATLGDLKVGDRIEVTYHKEGDTFLADRVTRLASKESPGGSSAGSRPGN